MSQLEDNTVVDEFLFVTEEDDDGYQEVFFGLTLQPPEGEQFNFYLSIHDLLYMYNMCIIEGANNFPIETEIIEADEGPKLQLVADNKEKEDDNNNE